MTKTISILGSTGSIGLSTLDIILKNKSKFNVILLTANKNYKKLLKQAIQLNAKYIYIKDQSKINFLKNKSRKYNFRVISNFEYFINNYKKKIDYTVSGISGLNGLYYNLLIIKKTKKLLIANKESIICGWSLLSKELKKNKSELIPIDSEHYSIYEILKNTNLNQIRDIYITASGGPFYYRKNLNLKKIKVLEALKHPKWKMGKKISIDSSTLMNKVFEVIEADRLFNISNKKIKILIHPESYIHAIVNLKNGISKSIMHNTDMKIPILAALSLDKLNLSRRIIEFKPKKIKTLNFNEVNKKQFKSVDILKSIPDRSTLFDTVLVSANDTLVDLFLKKKIYYSDIIKILKKVIKIKDLTKYKKFTPKTYRDVIKVSNNVRLKTLSLSVLSRNV